MRNRTVIYLLSSLIPFFFKSFVSCSCFLYHSCLFTLFSYVLEPVIIRSDHVHTPRSEVFRTRLKPRFCLFLDLIIMIQFNYQNNYILFNILSRRSFLFWSFGSMANRLFSPFFFSEFELSSVLFSFSCLSSFCLPSEEVSFSACSSFRIFFNLCCISSFFGLIVSKFTLIC